MPTSQRIRSSPAFCLCAVSSRFYRECLTTNKIKMEHKNLNTPQNPPLQQTAANSRLNVYEYIWSKVFPNEELNYDDFYDWSRENANRALELALEYCDLNCC